MQEIDEASRNVKYDHKRKMSYFKIVVNRKYTSGDLFNVVQKFFHMIELYHITIRSNIADFHEHSDLDSEQSSPVTGAITKNCDYTIRDLIDGKIKREHSK
jgi:hypothetical protein